MLVPALQNALVVALVALGGTLCCKGPSAAQTAPAFDCSLSADRVDALLGEIRKDAEDYQTLRTEIAADEGRIATSQDDPKALGRRHVAAYIRKTMQGRLAALLKEVRVARARMCLTDARADEITARGTALADKVLSSRP